MYGRVGGVKLSEQAANKNISPYKALLLLAATQKLSSEKTCQKCFNFSESCKKCGADVVPCDVRAEHLNLKC